MPTETSRSEPLGGQDSGDSPGQFQTWDLNAVPQIQWATGVHRAEFFDDGTFACMTSKGLFVRHRDVSTGGDPQYPWWSDGVVGGKWFAKRTAPVFPIFEAFYDVLRRFAPQSAS